MLTLSNAPSLRTPLARCLTLVHAFAWVCACSAVWAQRTAEPVAPQNVPDVTSAAAPTAAPSTTAATAATAPAVNAGRAYTFAGRELLSKFSLAGDWVEADKAFTQAGVSSRLVPRGQSATQFNQRIAVLELPSWVNPTRLGQEYLNGMLDDCASGTLKLVQQGNVSQFPADIVMLECADNTAQRVKLAYAALVRGPQANLVFSRLSLLPAKMANPAQVALSELNVFKQLLSTLFVCTPAAPKLCQ
jgi:hypothetical protein